MMYIMFDSTKKNIDAIRATPAMTLICIYGVASENININIINAE